MKAIFFAIGLLAISAVAFAEEEKKELTEGGREILNQLRELRKEEEDALAAIEDEKEKDLITTILEKEDDEADKLEETEESTRVKRAARRRHRRGGRRGAARRAHRRDLRAHPATYAMPFCAFICSRYSLDARLPQKTTSSQGS
ncbi:hypothetical protein ANCDUO_16457 [Ancylostoma duodenale]|uniref:Uncharacterized protein n=1 Tax=Ancylostoma duodenale TaxID=51022 RepID=A0A0C2CAW0_9BILA|nr:hypothetical protein ANCDUO_16457 [Ancylostoma duodenale]